MDIYRVEKDGMTFYVQPEQIGFYEAEGYTIYRQYEQVVSDVAAEAERISSRYESGVVISEVTSNG